MRDELLEVNPALIELIPQTKDLRSLNDLDKSVGSKKLSSIGSGDYKSKERNKYVNSS